MNTLKTYTIVCEGPSEVSYIKSLSRIMRELNINICLYTKDAGGGNFKKISSAYRKARAENRRQTGVYILLDKDIYVRNRTSSERNNSECYNACSYKDAFLFNTFNFEDFLVMHLSDAEHDLWVNTCIANNHFNMPLTSDQHISILRSKIGKFSKYVKGELPFVLAVSHLVNAFKHLASQYFISDFIVKLHQIAPELFTEQ